MRLRMIRTGRVWTLVAIGWILASGCSKDEGGATVNGKITYKGAPVAQGSISFIPRGGPVASSSIQPDGSYALRAPNGAERIPVASYDVVITAIDDPLARGGDERSAKMTFLVPLSVLRLGTTPLRYDVVEGPNTIDVNLDNLPEKSQGAN